MSLHRPQSVMIHNIGPTSSQWLCDAGLTSADAIRKIGAVEAYRRVKKLRMKTSLNLLWALAAGLQQRHWQDLTAAERSDLLLELNALDDVEKQMDKR